MIVFFLAIELVLDTLSFNIYPLPCSPLFYKQFMVSTAAWLWGLCDVRSKRSLCDLLYVAQIFEIMTDPMTTCVPGSISIPLLLGLLFQVRSNMDEYPPITCPCMGSLGTVHTKDRWYQTTCVSPNWFERMDTETMYTASDKSSVTGYIMCFHVSHWWFLW